MNEIHIIIKELRKKAGLTQFDLAEKLGLTQSNYAHLEAGKIDITFSRLKKIAEVFNISISELLGIDNNSGAVAVDNSEELEKLRKDIEQLKDKNELLSSNIIQLLNFTYKEIGNKLGIWEPENFEKNEKKDLVLKKEYAQQIENELFSIDFIFYIFEKELVDNIHFKEMFAQFKQRKKENKK